MTPDPTSKAQRLWPRWFIAGTKPVKIDLGPAGSGPLVDISGGGLRVQSLAPLRRGAEVPVRIDIPDKPEALQCTGIVVWSKPNGAAGIRFTSLNETQKNVLNAWLAELESAATSPAPSQVQDEFTTVVSQIRGAQLNNADALNLIVRRANGLNSVSGASIALGTAENMVCMATAGDAAKVGSAIPAVIGLRGECVFKRKTVHSEDSKNDPRVGREAAFGSAVILPLIVNGEVRGVLEAFSKRAYAFTPTTIEALEKFADAVIFVTHGIVTPRRLATAKPSLAPISTGLGPKPVVPASSAAATAPTAPASTPTFSQPAVPATSNTTSAVNMAALNMPVRATAVEVVPMGDNIAAVPVAVPSGRQRSVEWETRPRTVPTTKLPPRWQDERQAKSSPTLKWAAVAAVLLAVSAIPGWYFLKHRQLTISTADAASLNGSSTIAESEPLTQATPIFQKVAAITVPVQPIKEKAAPVVSANVVKEVVPATPKHESKPVSAAPAPHEPKAAAPAPAPHEPIVLATNTPKAPRPVDLDTIVPVKLPAAISGPGSTQIALPTTAKSAPQLATPIPDVRTAGTLIKRVNPAYPQLAKSAGIRGTVELQVHVTPEGVVDKVRVASGQPMLANAATEAVKQWRYDPAKINGKPVEMETTVRLNFDLQR